MRKSGIMLEETYFWTNTVKDWKNLLAPDKYKNLVINTLNNLIQKELIRVYGFVIMPNHLHLIWKMIRKNGKEMPHASFNKATAHEIIKDLQAFHPNVLPYFKVIEPERSHRVWQRDPLAQRIYSRSMIEQKLDYIHFNPLQEKWQLAKRPEEYEWSSAAFYELSKPCTVLITDYREEW